MSYPYHLATVEETDLLESQHLDIRRFVATQVGFFSLHIWTEDGPLCHCRGGRCMSVAVGPLRLWHHMCCRCMAAWRKDQRGKGKP
jgi:hypothetical protein